MQEQVCKNCGNHFTGKFCNSCGEKVYTSKDKSILHFIEEGFHFITHFEGTFFTTLKAVLFKPGKLSLNYCDGVRKKYFKPLSFFLLLVILYLIFPFYVGLNMPLNFYLFEKKYAAKAITAKTGINMDSVINIAEYKAIQKGINTGPQAFYFKAHAVDSIMENNYKLASLKSSYTKKSEKTSKLLLFILIPLSALLLYGFFFKARPYFYDHLILATEICCFYMLFSFFLMPLLTNLAYILLPSKIMAGLTDNDVVSFSMLMLCIYSVIAFWRFYKVNWILVLPLAAIFVMAHNDFVQVIYKYLLFTITLALSH